MEKINWKYLDKVSKEMIFIFLRTPVKYILLFQGTLYTISYLIQIIHELLPLEQTLENKLICHLIECLTHAKLRYEHDEYEIDEESSNGDNNETFNRQQHKISIHNSDKKMQKKQFLILHNIIKELCRKPLELTTLGSKPLGVSQFRKAAHYDYEEDVDE